MYSTYLPAFEKLYRDAGHSMELVPKCLEIGEIEGNLYFIFEDLAIQGYLSADRTKGLDMTHMRLSLQKLAEFHAASVVYQDRHGPYPTDFEHGFVKKDNIEHSLQGFNIKYPELQASMKSWGLDESYLKKVVGFSVLSVGFYLIRLSFSPLLGSTGRSAKNLLSSIRKTSMSSLMEIFLPIMSCTSMI